MKGEWTRVKGGNEREKEEGKVLFIPLTSTRTRIHFDYHAVYTDDA